MDRINQLWKEVQDKAGVQSDYRLRETPSFQGYIHGWNLVTDRDTKTIEWFGLFDVFSDNAIKGMLAHELGHTQTELRHQERFADKFAADKGFAAENIEALTTLGEREGQGMPARGPYPSDQQRIDFFKGYLTKGASA